MSDQRQTSEGPTPNVHPATRPPRSRRNPLLFPLGLALGGLVVLLAALVGLRQDPVTTPPAEDGGLFPADAPVLVSDRFGPTLEVYPVRIVHTVSQEQFAVGVFDPQTGPIEAGSIDLRFYKAANGEAVLTETVAAEIVPNRALGEPDRELAVGMGLAGAFIARPTIDAPGPWIVVALASLPDGTQRAGQADFMVEAGTPIPSPG